jgi:hypothetical protein
MRERPQYRSHNFLLVVVKIVDAYLAVNILVQFGAGAQGCE